MAGEFNAATPDDPATRYFSFGADMAAPPRLLSPFRQSHRVIAEAEGPNDGLVSVESARWGEYRGTLVGVSHLDLINWSNRVRWAMGEWMGWKRAVQRRGAVPRYCRYAGQGRPVGEKNRLPQLILARPDHLLAYLVRLANPAATKPLVVTSVTNAGDVTNAGNKAHIMLRPMRHQ